MSCSHTWNPECINCLDESLLHCEQALAQEKCEKAKLQAALAHCRYRTHKHSVGCDACGEIDDLLGESKG